VAGNVEIPVIASGGAGNPDHLHDALTRGKASAALVASIVHYGTYPVRDIKARLAARGLAVRPVAQAAAGDEGAGARECEGWDGGAVDGDGADGGGHGRDGGGRVPPPSGRA
jgi:hypothetical protein